MLEKQYCVYIMTTKNNTTLYTGVTNDLIRRVLEHKNHLIYGFSRRYNTERLTYYEATEDVNSAIAKEKQIKGWLRKKKIALIEAMNLEWEDMYAKITEG
jgi:putative endonuclease